MNFGRYRLPSLSGRYIFLNSFPVSFFYFLSSSTTLLSLSSLPASIPSAAARTSIPSYHSPHFHPCRRCSCCGESWVSPGFSLNVVTSPLVVKMVSKRHGEQRAVSQLTEVSLLRKIHVFFMSTRLCISFIQKSCLLKQNVSQ